jgi:hypothetical protein
MTKNYTSADISTTSIRINRVWVPKDSDNASLVREYKTLAQLYVNSQLFKETTVLTYPAFALLW